MIQTICDGCGEVIDVDSHVGEFCEKCSCDGEIACVIRTCGFRVMREGESYEDFNARTGFVIKDGIWFCPVCWDTLFVK